MRHLESIRIAFALTALAVVAPAVAQLGIDLTPAEKAKEQPRKPDSAGKQRTRSTPGAVTPPQNAPVTMPELDVGARKGEGGRRIADANKVFAGGDFQTAALAYDAILREPGLGEVHDEARYQLAKSLARLDLNHASLARLDDILSKGPQGTKFYTNAVEWLFVVAKKT